MGQEQGHRWLAYVKYSGADPNLLLGRDNQHWSFFFNIESTLSTPAARRASAMEGNVWREDELADSISQQIAWDWMHRAGKMPLGYSTAR